MSIYDKLNAMQKEAVFHTEGPLLILAGAGSGKTRVITHRVAYLIDQMGVDGSNILAITFTNKAAEEMRDRVDSLVGYGSGKIWISTFHSMCVKILRRYSDYIGFENNFSIYDTDDQKTVITGVMKKLDIDTKKIKDRAVLKEISWCKDRGISPEVYMLNYARTYEQKIYGECYRAYEIELKKNNAFDFDDLILKTVNLFENNPDVLAIYQKMWQYIMVDEYQDTNATQFALIKLLAGKHHNICVVGDDDQSIYKFRGADVTNILNFQTSFPEAKVVKLEQNYRSTSNILEAANSVIRNNSSRMDKTLWTNREDVERIHFRELDTGYEEAEYVCDSIIKDVTAGKCEYRDNVILYRTNAQSRMFEEKLVVQNLPYKLVGGVNFYARREIKDLLAYLKTIANGQDNLACRRIINIPKRGIGAVSINKISDVADAHGVSFFTALCHPEWTGITGNAADKLHSFSNMILRLRAVSEEEGPRKALTEVLDLTDYINQMDVDSDEEAEERIDNIEELISKITAYENDSENPSLSDFLEQVSLVADIDSLDAENNAISLMTVHSAKGLEFRNVYLVGMEEYLFPSKLSVNAGDIEIEEERRLAYVAITRAKDVLTITAARTRYIHGEQVAYGLSRFIKEIPRTLFDIAPVVRRQRDDYSYYDSDTSDFGGRRHYDSFRDDEGSGFSGFGGFKRTPDAPSPSSENPYAKFSRPRAFYAPKSTPEEDKPFVARKENLGLLTKGSDITAASASSDIKKGDRVRHIKFGDGTVLSVVPETKDKKVTVQFDTCGQKIMYASFAKLQKL